jgi:hypothetical protein
MYDFLKKEINRQEHMDMRYKSLDEELYKQDDNESPKAENDDTEIKYLEQNFLEFKNKIFENIGIHNEDDNEAEHDDK